MVASFKIKLTVGIAAIGIVAISLASCGDQATLPVSAGAGAYPQLPSPNSALFPTVNIAPAKGWTDNAGPIAAPGFKVATFADGLDHPRWLYVLPNGDVLVAETNAPPKPEDGKGIKGWFMKRFMSEAGATSPTANRITLLRDADGDGVAETHSLFLRNLNSPFGMALVGDTLYVANTDAVMKYPYKGGETLISDPGIKVADLPAGPINHHWTKSLIASRDGKHLYVGVGSNSNAGENGIDKEDGRAAIWEIDPVTGGHSVFASGLRNPVGLAWEPVGGNLWAVVNERDELGSDLVPDYLTSVKYGGFYGWPYSYFGKHLDPRVNPQRPDLVARAIVPDYALGPHVAPLGLAFARKGDLPSGYVDGAFVAQHGSWNREPKSGYKVVFIPFAKGRPSGDVVDILTGFLDEDGNARGRPVGIVLDRKGALLVADDVGNRIWLVSGTEHIAQAAGGGAKASKPKLSSKAKSSPDDKKAASPR